MSSKSRHKHKEQTTQLTLRVMEQLAAKSILMKCGIYVLPEISAIYETIRPTTGYPQSAGSKAEMVHCIYPSWSFFKGRKEGAQNTKKHQELYSKYLEVFSKHFQQLM